MTSYPEHEKLAKIADKSQTMGEWVEWLQGKGYVLAEYGTGEPGDDRSPHRLYAVHSNPSELLAEFFDIDRDKIEAEKRQMLEEMRAHLHAAEENQAEDK